jgi:cell division protein FtsA
MGLKKGVVVNIEATLRSAAAAVEAAELMSGQAVDGCWIGLGGAQTEGLTSRGVVAVNGKNREISAGDVSRVLEAARAVGLSMDRQILEAIPLRYAVDSQSGIRDPLHMIGVRLECEVHLITCSMTSAQNLVKCVNRAGFRVNGLILQTLAAGRAVLTPEEKEAGVALLDLGGGTSNILVYKDGAAFFAASVPAGGSHVTNDISVVKSITFEAAEKIKIEAASCWEEDAEGASGEVIVPGMGGRAPTAIPRAELAQIVRPRMMEIFELAMAKLKEACPKSALSGGMVITGGGANLQGAADLATEVFRLPARVGSTLPVAGLGDSYRNPAYATAVGLVLEAGEREEAEALPVKTEKNSEGHLLSALGKIGGWVKREFF